MNNSLLIFLGAGLGGVTRFWISNIVHWWLSRDFPYGTLIVNVSGCFLMGILFVLIIERISEAGPSLRALILIGFLGGYTTFSSFSIETLSLFENGAWMNALLNIIFSTGLCMIAVWIGVILGRTL
jgi:CrcB protein